MDYGVIAGAVICIIGFLVAFIGGTALYFTSSPRERSGSGKYTIGLPLAALAGLCFVLFPFNGNYLSYHTESGQVTAASSRFLQTGSGSTASVNQRYAVSIAGKGTFGCDDTRCSLVKAGDTVSLSCEKEWQWHGAPGWVCSFNSLLRGGKRVA